MPEFDEESKKNAGELNLMLRMFRGQKLLGHAFNPDFTELSLFFEDFVLTINLKNAKWDTLDNMTVFSSPIMDRISWDK